ncbi:MAG: hemin uptake protein HemP [Myxococcota bacterium]
MAESDEDDTMRELGNTAMRLDDVPGTAPTVRATELLGENGLVYIEHNGQLYTLRLTRNDKLILTK